MNDADAYFFRVARAFEVDGLAAKQNLTFKIGEDSGEQLHQRTLAGAVLTDNGVQLAGQNVERDVGEGGDAGEALGDVLNGDERSHLTSDGLSRRDSIRRPRSKNTSTNAATAPPIALEEIAVEGFITMASTPASSVRFRMVTHPSAPGKNRLPCRRA